ncbi:MAG: hypothetical protein SCARUB_02997 [Candidatus Scalindua rubra]|uniref:Uncharacterized protein n=1 Tax=Candidatus Scalindua rubra TaxID=1872076 RepID=A0A1E3X8D2_9BACT|nr:MAG: hypothetical protein SCARUB_02997 [Candidatus Scalindua rubra]
MKLKRVRLFKACLVLILCFSIFPEVVFSYEDTYDKVKIASASSEGTNPCDEHNCPILPNEPFHHCAVCCVVSHSFITLSSGIIFHFSNTSQPSSMAEDVLYKELFAKTLFRPPQSIL